MNSWDSSMWNYKGRMCAQELNKKSKVATELTFSLLFHCFQSHKNRENKTLKWSNIILSNIIVLYINKSSNITVILHKYCTSMKYYLKYYTDSHKSEIHKKFSKPECIALVTSLDQIRTWKMLLSVTEYCVLQPHANFLMVSHMLLLLCQILAKPRQW